MKIYKINEDNKWNPFLAITYLIDLNVLFEGFEYTILKFKLLFHDEKITVDLIKNRIDERLKVFTNIVSYDIIKSEEATEKDRILPMY